MGIISIEALMKVYKLTTRNNIYKQTVQNYLQLIIFALKLLNYENCFKNIQNKHFLMATFVAAYVKIKGNTCEKESTCEKTFKIFLYNFNFNFCNDL